MLGHKAFELLSLHDKYEVFGTLRNEYDFTKNFKDLKTSRNIFTGVDAFKPNSVLELIENLDPDLVLNCIGIIKQLKESHNPLLSIEINSLFPHRLATHLEGSNTRLIHISTDCVFSGEKGNYTESDFSDAKDLYGKSKFLGELVNYKNSITLRTSIIGPELKGKMSLLEWFLSQKESVNGYVNAIYSGLTTTELIKIIATYIVPENDNYGLYHVSSNPISKYDLLVEIAREFNFDINIHRFEEFINNKSLISQKFENDFGYKKKSWNKMILEMKKNMIEKT